MDRILHLAAWWLSVTAVTLHQCAASPTESPSIRFSVAPTCLHTTCLLQKDNKGGCFRRREGSGHCASSIWPRCSVNGSAECHTQRRIDGSKILYCVHSDTTSQQRASRAKLGREDARQTSIYFRQKIPNIIFSEMNSSLFFPPLSPRAKTKATRRETMETSARVENSSTTDKSDVRLVTLECCSHCLINYLIKWIIQVKNSVVISSPWFLAQMAII